MIKLLVRHGHLYTPGNEHTDGEDMMLIHVYPAGDCDTIPWPMVSLWEGSSYTREKLRGLLASALFDAYEMGHVIGGERTVVLPDGTKFEVDFELGVWEAMRAEERHYGSRT